MLRRHDADQDVGALHYFFQVTADHHRFRDDMTGQKLLVHPFAADALNYFSFMRPESHPMHAFAPENDRQACAPCASSDNCDLTHLCPKENLGSWPDSSRLMF